MKKKILCRLVALVLLFVLAVPAAASEDEVVIVLDPGHGGYSSGTTAVYDGVEVWESHLTLKIALACRDYLEENYENVRVYMTREGDTDIDLDERVEFAAEKNADYLLSIHINSDKGVAAGALALVPRGKYRPEQAKVSTAVAEAILLELEALGMRNRGTVVQLGTGTYPDGSTTDYYSIVRDCVRANIPGIIMEHGFLDYPDDYYSFLSTDEKLAAQGRADALGLAKVLGLQEKGPEWTLPFGDVLPGFWYSDAVCYVWEQGLMQGLSDTEFGLTMTANRAMVVTMLYRLDGAQTEYQQWSFEDVSPDAWYHGPVEWARENGITTGISDFRFGPEQNVNREQFVTFLYRYAGEPLPEAEAAWFADWDSVSEYARDAVSWAVEAGLLTGYENGTVAPLRELNRAELAVLIQRFHLWLLHDRGELVYEWSLSDTQRELAPGEQFELTLVNQFGQKAEPEWVADCEGVVQIDGGTITAVGEGTALVSCEWDGEYFDCLVEVVDRDESWAISHTDVTISVGESFRLRVRNSAGETADVDWSASKSGYVTISGNQITGQAKGTVTVSCEFEGRTFSCIVRVK